MIVRIRVRRDAADLLFSASLLIVWIAGMAVVVTARILLG